MKKYILYIIPLVIGLVAGALFFGGGREGADSGAMAHQHGESTDSSKWSCPMHVQIQKHKTNTHTPSGQVIVMARSSKYTSQWSKNNATENSTSQWINNEI